MSNVLRAIEVATSHRDHDFRIKRGSSPSTSTILMNSTDVLPTGSRPHQISGPTSPQSSYIAAGSGQSYILFPTFTLESGVILHNVPLAYKTWGKLDPTHKNNVLVVCHALTGSADVEDWWGPLLGPGKVFDPTRFFIVCANVFGSPYGSAGPCTNKHGEDGKREKDWDGQGWWGPEFPATTVRDDVRATKQLLDYLGVEQIAAVIGGSMGGMAVLEWPLLFPIRFPPHTPNNVDSTIPSQPTQPYIRSIVPIATAARHSAWCISWAEAQRQSIYSDPAFDHGYYQPSAPPRAGLSAARMAALLTYRSRDSFESRFGRRIGGAKRGNGASASSWSNERHDRRASAAEEAVISHNEGNQSPRVVGSSNPSLSAIVSSDPSVTLPPPVSSSKTIASSKDTTSNGQTQSPTSTSIGKVFSAQSYLRYQGEKFVKRFDANCYVHLTRKMDTHDVARGRAHWGLGEIGKDAEKVARPIELDEIESQGTSTEEVNLGEKRLPREGEEDDDALSRVLSFLSEGSYRFGAPPPKVQVVSIESDGLFAPPEQQVLYQLIEGSTLVNVKSSDGHDGFLLEFEQINHHVETFLKSTIKDIYQGEGVGYSEWKDWGHASKDGLGTGGERAMQASEVDDSNRCNLRGMTSRELVERKEEPNELGGYFIINGNERLVRFLILPRSNHVTGLERPSFANRGPSYSKLGCSIRCVHPDDLIGITNTIHYLENGGITLRFSMRKQEYMIPIVMVLKALVNATDKEIFTALLQNDYKNTFLTDRVEMLLRGFKSYNLWTGDQCLEYIGSKFRIAMGLPEDYSDMQVGADLINRIILIHLDHPKEKFKMLIFMMRKLYSLVAGESCADNPDSPQHQEVLLPGFLYGQIIKERLDEYLSAIRAEINRQIRLNPLNVDFFSNTWISKAISKVIPNIGGRLSSFLATGNLSSPTGLDLQQTSGFTIVAEKLNFYRYISHFRCVHRGAFFAELKTTAVRKLLPESWGFLCPVHTPDGAPCGLLNHFSHTCRLITRTLDATSIPPLLTDLGMVSSFSPAVDGRHDIVIQLDGCILGYASPRLAQQMATALRVWKAEEAFGVPHDLEVGFVPTSKGGQFPGLYLFSCRSRMMRPVKLLQNGKEDSIGSFEQVYLNIACQSDEIEENHTTHVEYSPSSFLSLIASMTPFSDFNQSPRNIYQCQMGKQTMGTPSTALNHRTDNKLYRLQSPQTPIVRPAIHNQFGFDDAPNGANAVVAVISYTGYDMEDAMILNKSAHERGFGYGTIYKSEVIDLRDIASGSGKSTAILPVRFGFGNDIRGDSPFRLELDIDGLPIVANKVKAGSPICAIFDETTGKTMIKKYKVDEEAYIDTVRVIGSETTDAQATKIQITFRVPRSPVIGDKFSSRHGQKGVCSQKWPAIDMPFSESGMTPDVIINPHAFPSRMTIGMLIESMAGKAGAMHGIAQDATPFSFSEDDTPVEYFGEQLKAAGYNFVGHEPMYSGITGQELKMDIYLGVVYYQRLRHMVNDKFQVRTTGPVHQLTRQPIKGRKRAGGIRFGEMERDALLAHGTSFLLQDRLMNCSDYSTSYICRKCGSLISLGYDQDANLHGVQTIDRHTSSRANLGPKGEYCRICRDENGALVNGNGVDLADQTIVLPRDNVIKRGTGDLDVVAVPYVLKYLVAELASMSMRLSFKVES